jgi:hypothetical protein
MFVVGIFSVLGHEVTWFQLVCQLYSQLILITAMFLSKKLVYCSVWRKINLNIYYTCKLMRSPSFVFVHSSYHLLKAWTNLFKMCHGNWARVSLCVSLLSLQGNGSVKCISPFSVRLQCFNRRIVGRVFFSLLISKVIKCKDAASSFTRRILLFLWNILI